MHTIFITGCSGYVGSLLVDHLSKREDVSLIVGLDKEPLPKIIQENKKLHFLQKNTADDWEGEVARYNPDIVIHTAWQIRELYGKKDTQNMWNINGSHQVFDFAFNSASVKKLMHFGSVASYGAFATNDIGYRITEKTALRKTKYLYAEEKRVSEAMLEDMYQKHIQHSDLPQVYVLRPASITGPYGRLRTKFSLQSVLQGTVNDSFVSRTISKVMSFMPVTRTWVRQFVHEDDVIGAIEHLTCESNNAQYEVYNLCPEGEVVTGKQMGEILNKKIVYIHPEIIRIVFFFAWHVTRGLVPTPRGSYKTYSYPIVVDGSKITREYGYEYKYQTREAYTTSKGQYSSIKDIKDK